ncbi:MAG: hypothetical protein DRH32_02055 [Deltaproteobacteria bacterium]|nr:MAG: hypothetical protein DRH32_02055 [Deltaproteobacteria bacterium]
MKKFLITGLIIGFVLVLAGSSWGATVLDEILKKGELVVSTDANYAPQSFINDKGELEGFDVSVAKEVGKRMGVKVKFVTPDWDLITSGKWGKRWDLSIGSMTPTAERKQALYFTMPYYSSPAQFAVHKDNTTIKTIADLAGKRIGVATETTNERYLQRNLKIEGVKIVYQPWKAELRPIPPMPTISRIWPWATGCVWMRFLPPARLLRKPFTVAAVTAARSRCLVIRPILNPFALPWTRAVKTASPFWPGSMK